MIRNRDGINLILTRLKVRIQWKLYSKFWKIMFGCEFYIQPNYESYENRIKTFPGTQSLKVYVACALVSLKPKE